MTPQQIESMIRDEFNRSNSTSVQKSALSVGSGNVSHEFDLYEANKVIGGISTSPWFNKSGSNNTGGQDRVSSEILWLTLYPGREQRVLILSDKERFNRLKSKYSGCKFNYPIDIYYYDDEKCTIENNYSL